VIFGLIATLLPLGAIAVMVFKPSWRPGSNTATPNDAR
jgi:hypothetical protein